MVLLKNFTAVFVYERQAWNKNHEDCLRLETYFDRTSQYGIRVNKSVVGFDLFLFRCQKFSLFRMNFNSNGIAYGNLIWQREKECMLMSVWCSTVLWLLQFHCSLRSSFYFRGGSMVIRNFNCSMADWMNGGTTMLDYYLDGQLKRHHEG